MNGKMISDGARVFDRVSESYNHTWQKFVNDGLLYEKTTKALQFHENYKTR